MLHLGQVTPIHPQALFLECEGGVCNVRLTVPGGNEEEDLDVGRLLVEDGRALPFGA